MKKETFTMEGNNGGDYISLEQIDNDTMYFEVGSSCVVIIRCKIPVAVLTGILSGLLCEENTDDLKKIAEKYLGWDKEVKKKLIDKIN